MYLGDTAETTIYEARAGAYDYVTVGKFKLTKDIIVVDLKKINQISPFIEGLDCLEYAGIEYKSVMHSDGYNLALFDPDLFECVETQVYGIDMIDYRKHPIV